MAISMKACFEKARWRARGSCRHCQTMYMLANSKTVSNMAMAELFTMEMPMCSMRVNGATTRKKAMVCRLRRMAIAMRAVF